MPHVQLSNACVAELPSIPSLHAAIVTNSKIIYVFEAKHYEVYYGKLAQFCDESDSVLIEQSENNADIAMGDILGQEISTLHDF